MSKKQLKILAAAALTSAIVVPVAGFEASAATEVPTNGVYFYSADGTSKYIGAVEFASLSDAELDALLTEFGTENIHAIYDGEYLSLEGAIGGDQFKPYDNEIPNGNYTDITTGEDVPVDQTPSDKVTVDSVSAITETTTKVTKVTATVENQGEETSAKIDIYPVDSTDAVETLTGVSITEGKVTAEVTGLADGEYKVVVTVGEATGEATFTVDNATVDSLLDAINKAANQVDLYKALVAAELKYVDEAKVVAYESKLGASQTPKASLAEVQSVLNEEYVYDLIDNADTQIKLLNALNKGVEEGLLKDVIAEFIADYDTALNPTPASIEDIQSAINGVNENAADLADQILEATAAVEAAEAAIVPAKDATDTVALTEISTADTLVTALPSGATKTALEARVTVLENLETVINQVIAAEDDISTYPATNVAVTVLSDTGLAGQIKPTLVKRLSVFTYVSQVNLATSAAAVETILGSQNPTGWSTLDATAKTAVATTVFATGTDYTALSTYNNTVSDAVAEQKVVQAVRKATSAASLLTALNTGVATELSDETALLANVDAKNSEIYYKVLKGYTKGDSTPTVVAPLAETAVDTASEIQTAIITAANALVTDAATKLAAAKTNYSTGSAALTTAVENLPKGTAIANEYVAQAAVLKAVNTLGGADVTAAQTAVNALPSGELKTTLNEQLAAIGYVAQVNTAADAAAVKVILDKQAPTDWSSLSADSKTAVATTVFATGTDYTSATQYETAVFNAVAEQKIVSAVNTATTEAQLLAALKDAAAATNYDDSVVVSGLTVTDANSALYWAVVKGYTTVANSTVAAVTDANKDTSAKIKTNIVDAANTLATDVAGALTTANTTNNASNQAALKDKIDVLPTGAVAEKYTANYATLVVETTLTGADLTTATTAVGKLPAGKEKEDLQKRLAAIQHIVAVNAAVAPGAQGKVQTALDAYLADNAAYQALSADLKTDVAATVLADRSTGYTTATALNNAVTKALNIVAVNAAQTADEMRLALNKFASTDADYANATNVVKAEIADLVLEARGKLSTVKFANTQTAVEAALVAGVDAHQAKLAIVTALTTTSTISDTVTALGNLEYDAFDDAADQFAIAEEFLKIYVVVTTNPSTGVETKTAKQYTTLAAMYADIDAAIAAAK